ncbi:MAG: TolC family protein, partial [Deltaproteobacteria bacterium]
MKRWMIVSVLVALPAYAHADVVARALDGADAGGGSAAAQATQPTEQENDLIQWAGEPKAVTLPGLLQLAVQHAPALASAKLDIAVAEAQIAETWARHDWRLGAQLQYSKSGSQIFSGLALQGSTQAVASVDIGRVLPTGGTVDLKFDTNYSHTDASAIIPESTYWVTDISGSITQPLLKGYGSDLYNAQERRATLSRDVAVLARRLTALQTISQVVSAYWDLVLAEQQVAITE